MASSLQQMGIQYTSVGKAGFITALYIVIVPLLGLLFKRRVSGLIWVAVVIAVGGMYLLCITEGFSVGKGDLQFLVCGLLCAVPMLIMERPSLPQILAAWMPLIYAGVFSCGVGYTLQIVGQRHIDPTIASLILSLESVISVLAGWVILGQKLTVRELIGCILVFCAIILAQLPQKEEKIEEAPRRL